jgi:hypothetical protein
MNSHGNSRQDDAPSSRVQLQKHYRRPQTADSTIDNRQQSQTTSKTLNRECLLCARAVCCLHEIVVYFHAIVVEWGAGGGGLQGKVKRRRGIGVSRELPRRNCMRGYEG